MSPFSFYFTGTTPQSGGLGGSTPATQIPIFTIPTLPPQSSPNPAGTTLGPGVSTERLVVDASGNPVGTTLTGSSTGSNNNNRQLLLLLGLLPLLGAVALRNNDRVPPAVFPQQGVPLSSYYLGTGTGFGNFGPGGFPTPTGFSPGFVNPGFTPGRFGRSVSDESDENISSAGANGTRNEDALLYDPGNEMDTTQTSQLFRISVNTDDLNDSVSKKYDSGNSVEVDEIINVFPRSVNINADSNLAEVEESQLDDIPRDRHHRSSGNEYGQASNVYGNTNSIAGQWSTRSGGQGNTLSVPTQLTMGAGQHFNNHFKGNGGRMLLQGRKMRNGQRRQKTLSRDPDVINTDTIQAGRNGQRPFRSRMPSDTFRDDFNELLGSLDKTRGFQTNSNSLARRLFKGRRPSPHDWYMKLMSYSEPSTPRAK